LTPFKSPRVYANLTQRLLSIHLHYRIHALPARHCLAPQRHWHSHHCQSACLPCPNSLVVGSGREHHGRVRCGSESRWHCSIPSVCVLHCTWLPVFHQLVLSVWSCKISCIVCRSGCKIPGVWVRTGPPQRVYPWRTSSRRDSNFYQLPKYMLSQCSKTSRRISYHIGRACAHGCKALPFAPCLGSMHPTSSLVSISRPDNALDHDVWRRQRCAVIRPFTTSNALLLQ
jgi:hypothetical protein